MRLYQIVLLFFILGDLNAQSLSGLLGYYSFENCDAKDVSLSNSDGIVFGEPICECGVSGNGLYLDGVDDYVAFAGNIDAAFKKADFTLSFYFRVDEASGTHDVLSKRNNCDFERSFAVRYTPSSRTLFVDIAESSDTRTSFVQKIDPSLCWIHLTIVKDRRSHSIYINGEKVASQPVSDFLDITSVAPLQIGNGPCIGTTDRRFKGFIDEMRIYGRVLDDQEIRELYLGPDRIKTRDTTIYQGGSADLIAGNSCAPQITWSPASLVDNPNDATTLGTPSSTQEFVASYQYGGCTATDTVLVNVIDPSGIICGDIPMPNAFTPNHDGRNDEFFLSNPFAVETLHAFEIFDRLGNKVFTTDEPSARWDGTYGGQELNPGMFLYKVRYTCQGKERTKTGSVMLLR